MEISQLKNPGIESYYFDIDEHTDIQKIIELNPNTSIFDVVDILMDNKTKDSRNQSAPDH